MSSRATLQPVDGVQAQAGMLRQLLLGQAGVLAQATQASTKGLAVLRSLVGSLLSGHAPRIATGRGPVPAAPKARALRIPNTHFSSLPECVCPVCSPPPSRAA